MLKQYRNQRFQRFVQDMEAAGHVVLHGRRPDGVMGPGVFVYGTRTDPAKNGGLPTKLPYVMTREYATGHWIIYPLPYSEHLDRNYRFRRTTQVLILLAALCYLAFRFSRVGPRDVVSINAHGLWTPTSPSRDGGVGVFLSKGSYANY